MLEENVENWALLHWEYCFFSVWQAMKHINTLPCQICLYFTMWPFFFLPLSDDTHAPLCITLISSRKGKVKPRCPHSVRATQLAWQVRVPQRCPPGMQGYLQQGEMLVREWATRTLFSGLTWVSHLSLPGHGLFSATLLLCRTSALGAEQRVFAVCCWFFFFCDFGPG